MIAPVFTKWWNWHDEYAAASVDPRWNKVVENAKVTLNLND